jgi:hypothetical protein
MPGFAPVQKAPAVAPAQKNKKQAAAIQPKLSVNTPGDRYEKEADRTADKVMRSPASGPAPAISTLGASAQRAMTAAPTPKRDEKQKVQRATDTAAVTAPKREDKKNTTPAQVQRAASRLDDGAKTLDRNTRELARDHGRDPRVQRKTEEVKPDKPKSNAPAAVQRDSAGGGGGEVPSGFETTLSRAQQAGGNSLPPATMQRMESGFGRSFGDVRIHSDGAADTAARAIDARAFTLGRDVYFAQGQYQPHSASGQHLLAHELTHVVQQSGQTASPQMAQRAKRPITDESKKQTASLTATPPAATPAAPAGLPPTFSDPAGKRSIIAEPVKQGDKKGTLVLPQLEIPFLDKAPKGASDADPGLQGVPQKEKSPITKQSFTYLGKGTRKSDSPRQTFLKSARENKIIPKGVTEAIEDKFGKAPGVLVRETTKYFALMPKHETSNLLFLGTAADLANQEYMIAPSWNDQGKRHPFDADHLHEMQLGGDDSYNNLWLLDMSTNRSSGSLIRARFEAAVKKLIEAADRKGNNPSLPPAQQTFWQEGQGGDKPSFDEVRENWRIQFTGFKEVETSGNNKHTRWTRQQLEAGDHLNALEQLSEKKLIAMGLRLEPGVQPKTILVFPSKNGGEYRLLTKKGSKWVDPRGDAKEPVKGLSDGKIDIKNFQTVTEGTQAGSISGAPFKEASGKGKAFKPPDHIDIALKQSPALGFGVYADSTGVAEALSHIEIEGMSPVKATGAGISQAGALFMEGAIETTTPLFPQIRIPIRVEGDAVYVSFPIPVDKLRLGPLHASWASLSVVVQKGDIGLEGGLGFEIDGIGHGELHAGAETAPAAAAPKAKGDKATPAAAEPSHGIALSGQFDFDLKVLNPARIGVSYQNGHLSVTGDLGVQKGAIPGISDAKIHVEHDDKGTTVDGTATLSVPGLDGTELQISRDKDNRIEIGADNIPLPVGKLPGVKSAIASIHAVRDPKAGWSVRGIGTVQAGVPGINGQLGIDIDGELLTISGGADVAHGIMSGHANLLVTNRPRTPEGLPQPGRYPQVQPTELSLTGKGAVSLQLGRLLKGTVGIEILPNAEIALSGTVALPPTVDVFPQQKFEHVLFSPPPLDIPILGLSAAGHRFGIFATIGGALSFKASLGPGQLRDTALTVDYNPSHPDQASVHGDATFYVPAQAGLRLAIHGGIGAGLAIVDVTGGIEVGAELGIAAEASAHVAVDWTPSAGVSLEANAHFAASPQFTFDVSAYVEVELDLLLKTIDVYSHRWKLASFTYGPALNFGLDVPVRWSERAGLDFDPGRVRVQRPDINIADTIGGLVHHIVG